MVLFVNNNHKLLLINPEGIVNNNHKLLLINPEGIVNNLIFMY
jgi:hypothetical protein